MMQQHLGDPNSTPGASQRNKSLLKRVTGMSTNHEEGLEKHSLPEPGTNKDMAV